MTHSNLEDSQSFNQLLKSGRFSHSRKVLTGNFAVTLNGPLVTFLDPNGSNRDVILPALEKGRFYVVSHVGSTNSLVVKNSVGATIATLIAGDTTLLFASDTEWVALRGWAALGVFTNTVNGLVPAPNSAVPGSLFLRDDGQWGQVQVTGIVDAFKFITDGTNTAIGAGPDTFRLRSSTSKVGIVVTNNEAVFGDNANFTVNEASVDHDQLLNFLADEHIGHSSVTLTAGVGLAGGGNIAASRTFDLDLNDLTTDTPVLADTFAFYDVSGSDTNKATLTTLNGILSITALNGYVADQHVAHSGVSIITGATSGLSGGGDITASRTLLLDINRLTADTPVLGDSIAFFDLSGNDTNKCTLTQVNAIIDHNSLLNYVANQHVDHTAVTLTAGAGLVGGGTIAASRTFDVGAGEGINVGTNAIALDFNSLITQTVATGDIFAFWDISTSTHGKSTFAGLNSALDHNSLLNYVANQHIDHTAVTITTTEGIQGGGTIAANRTFKLDINGLTVDATPDGAADYVTTYDASATTHKKVLLNNLPGGLNMTGHKGQIFGLLLSVAGGSATFTTTVGEAADSTNVDIMVLGSSYTKTTSAWAVGSGNGALDTGSIAASTWYHVFLIKRSDTGVVDLLISLSATAPTMPTNYNRSRRIGSMKTDGSSQWVKFSQQGDEFLWDVPTQDSTNVESTTSALRTLNVPTGVKPIALVWGLGVNAAAGNTWLITSPDQADSATSSSLFTGIVGANSQNANWSGQYRVDSLSRVRVRASAATTTVFINTMGWIDYRGRMY